MQDLYHQQYQQVLENPSETPSLRVQVLSLIGLLCPLEPLRNPNPKGPSTLYCRTLGPFWVTGQRERDRRVGRAAEGSGFI